MSTLYWLGFEFSLVPALVRAAEEKRKAVVKKTRYKLMAGMALAILLSLALTKKQRGTQRRGV